MFELTSPKLIKLIRIYFISISICCVKMYYVFHINFVLNIYLFELTSPKLIYFLVSIR